MSKNMFILAIAIICIVVFATSTRVVSQSKGKPASSLVARGKYLTTIASCNDCHSPKIFTPQGPIPDTTKLLSGHPANATLPPLSDGIVGMGPDKWGGITSFDFTGWSGAWGTSYSANLTPDKETGLGSWTADMFIKALRTGKHMGKGRDIQPPMPWFFIGKMTDQDLKAVFAYLQSLPPISNAVPDPIPPAEAPKK